MRILVFAAIFAVITLNVALANHGRLHGIPADPPPDPRQCFTLDGKLICP